MEEQPNPFGGSESFAPDHAESPRRHLLRRLRILLLTGGLAFALTTWMLVRFENPAAFFGFGPGPASVAREHLDAVRSGELRRAYGLFSASYRQRVPFEAYHRLVVTHRDMFRTESVQIQVKETAGNRTILLGQMVSADGEHYVAQFTMVRWEGRWWIDDLRWALAPDTNLIIT